MHYPERRKKPRDTDRLKLAKDRLDEVIYDARWLRSQLEAVRGGDTKPPPSARPGNKRRRDS